MKILAFETSCDDTAVAIIENGTNVLASIRNSQPDHSVWGGVVPELAARLHAENWQTTLQECFSAAKLDFKDIDIIAVTQGPGLQTSLLTGTTSASFLAYLFQKPLIPVHHILGHIFSPFLDRDPSEVKLPALILTVSGGHTSMYLHETIGHVKLLGSTLDDAAGEAFDKVAKMLGLGYPGGPIVSEYATKGDPTAYKFPRIFLAKGNLDFSFSGLKGAVYREIQLHKDAGNQIDETFIANICASFETAVAETFVQKIKRALQQYPQIAQIHFVGGVSANTFIREKIRGFLAPLSLDLLFPVDFDHCTDNAAMIGCAGHFLYQNNPSLATTNQFIEASANLQI